MKNKRAGLIASAGLAVITFFALLPVFWAFSVSLRTSSTVFEPTLFPKAPTLASYVSILADSKYRIWLSNSLIVAGMSSLIALILGTLAAYGLSRFRVKFGSPVKFYMISTKMIPPILLSISYFLIIQSIGLYDTLAAVVIMDTAAVLPFVIWLMLAFLDGVPQELDEAGLIDGCSRAGVLFRILLPNSLPQLIAVATYCFLLSWNEYLYALVFTGSEVKRTFTIGITSFVGQWWTNYPGMMAGALIATAPVVVVFLSLQRYIVNTMTGAAIK